MNVVNIVDNMVVGGAGRVVESLFVMTQLYKLGFLVIANKGDPGYFRSLGKKGINILNMSDINITDLIDNNSVVIIHRSGNYNKGDVDLILNLREYCNPIAILERNIFGYFDRLSEFLFDKILCNSMHSMWRIKQEITGEFDFSKYHLMYNPIDVSLFSKNINKISARKKLNLPKGAFIIGDSCRPAKEKLSILLFCTAKELLKIYPDLIIVTRRYPDIMAKKFKKLLGVRYINLDFEKNMENTNIFYKSLDIYIHFSTMGESFGMANAEAMISGIPVIVNETPGNKNNNAQVEMISDLRNGYICNSVSETITRVNEICSTDTSNLITKAKEQFVDGVFSPMFNFEKVMDSIGVNLDYNYAKKDINTNIEEYMENYKDSLVKPRFIFGRYIISDLRYNIREFIWRIERKLRK